MAEKKLHCPSCKGDKVHSIWFQFRQYLQCMKCKYWSTKYTPENPGAFAALMLFLVASVQLVQALGRALTLSTEYLMLSNIPANAVRDLMVNADTGESDSRFIGRPSQVTFAIVASAVGIELEVRSGERTVVPRSTLEAGGTTGVYPNIDQKAVQFFAAAGEKLLFRVRETAAVATTDIMLSLDVTPIA